MGLTDFLPQYPDVPGTHRVFIALIASGRYEVTPAADGNYLVTPRPGSEPVPPRRVVDRFQASWQLQDGTGYYRIHQPVPGETYFGWDLARLTAARGPVRPVVPPAESDLGDIIFALAKARRNAAGSLISALGVLRNRCQHADGNYLRMTAGMPGSQESSDLLRLAGHGEVISTYGHFDEQARAVVLATLERWVFTEQSYVEVAGNLAEALGRLVDGRGGWDEVSEERLARSDAGQLAQRLFTGRSRSETGSADADPVG